MLRNMAASLLRHETIRTTLPKAKELRRVVEPLITLARTDTEARRRLAFGRLRDAEVVTKLFTDLAPRFRSRPGGYTRILHMLPRPGDAAPMALMQLVEQGAAAQAVAPVPEPAAPERDEAPSRKASTKTAGKTRKRKAGDADAGEATPQKPARTPRRKKKATAS